MPHNFKISYLMDNSHKIERGLSMNRKILENSLVKNTLILIIGNMFIKILALANRVILTRLLGNEGISLYMISLPTIMLFLSIGSLSLNTSVTKLVAEKEDQSIIKKALKIAIISSLIVGIILIILAKPIAYTWVRQVKIYYPILLSAPLITLTAINSVLRGYYNGIKKVNITTISILVEQVIRILASIILLIIFINRGIIFATCIAITAMSIGEFASIIYTIFNLKRYRLPQLNNTNTQDILDIAFPITATRLIGNLTYFLEPIVFTFSLSLLNYQADKILFLYSETTAYTVPLITMFSFISLALASAIIPYVATASGNEIAKYIRKAIFYSLIPAIPITIILLIYADQFMNLIYNTSIGSANVSKYCIFFIIYYIQSPLIAIMQAKNHSKKLLRIIAINDFFKLGLIFLLPFITKDALIIALIIPSTIITTTIYLFLKKHYYFRFKFHEKLNFIILASVTVIFGMVTKIGNINYLFAAILILILFILTSIILNIFRLDNE